MIGFLRYLVSFVGFTSWYGAQILGSALLGVLQRRDGVYDRSARAWGRAMLRGTGIVSRVEGRERLDPAVPAVYVANHASFADIWAILAEFPGTVRFVYKKQMDWIPIMGLCMRAMKHIPIDRKKLSQAFAAYDGATERIRQGTSAVVFVEGTRSLDGRLLPFKKGSFVLAIAAQAPVIPVFCENTYQLMPRGSFSPKPGTVTLRIGVPIQTAGLSYQDRDRLARQARAALVGLGAKEGEG
jgi:1-acyl-sn-glycerol-3-phosphate acyltransferase